MNGLKKVQDENSNLVESEEEDDDLATGDDTFLPPPSFELQYPCPAPEVPQLSRKLTEEEQKEVALLVDLLLGDRLGSCAPLVVRYLGRARDKRSKMPVLHTAKSSLRYNVSPAAAAAIATGFFQNLPRNAVMAQSKEGDQERMKEEEITCVYFDNLASMESFIQ